MLLLERERPRLEALARALLERETLDQTDAYEIAGVPVPVPLEEKAEGLAQSAAFRRELAPSAACPRPATAATGSAMQTRLRPFAFAS